MAMTLPTKWTDLDWDNPDPWDIRYYQSLIAATHERVWQQPAVTPLESNTYPPALRTNGVPYKVNYYSPYVLVQPWAYLSPKMMRSGEIFNQIREMIDFALNYHYAYFVSNSLSPRMREIRGWVNDLSSYDAYAYKKMTMDDIIAVGEDTSWLLYSPQYGEPIDSDGAKMFLKAAKKAVQKMRYIRLVNPNTIGWDLGYCDTMEYKTVPSEALAIAVNKLNSNPDAKTHDFGFPTAEIYMNIAYGGPGPGGRYISLLLRRKDLRWVNQFRWPVDLYAKIYNYPAGYHQPTFDDFGLGFFDGQIIAYGKKEIGEGIDNIFGSNPLPVTENAVFDGENARGYSMLASLLADAGPYFSFNCSD